MLTEFILLFSIFLFILYKFDQKPKGLPPGYWGLPLIGVIPVGDKGFEKLLNRLSTKYGGEGIYCSKIGSRPGVVLTNYKIIKTALSKLEFSGRPDFHTFLAFGEGLGLSMTGGLVWQTNRRFTIKALRDIGMGKSIMESHYEREVAALIEHLDTKIGQPTELSVVINVTVLNILWSIVSGRRFDLEDKDAYKLINMNKENLRLLQSSVILLDAYPVLDKYLPTFIKNNLLQAGVLKDNREAHKKFMMKIIKEHIEKLDKINPENFIDMYLVSIQENNTDPALDFRKNLNNLTQLLINIFNAGSDVTAAGVRWLINFLVIHPDWQEIIQKEIDENIAGDGIVHYREKEKYPLLEACMHESFRKSSQNPLGVPHATTEDTILEGYHIPKGYVIVTALEICHNDPKYWERPKEFYPEHFLNEDGTFNGKRESFLPFVLGKRVCIGEGVAKYSIFTLVAAMLKRYSIKPAPGEVLTYDADKSLAMFNSPKQYKFIFERRH